ncbi:hypothetical protein LA345_36820 (plasmid) [Burkholderia vietnamiensis]|uniref:Uncharacterized protein n=1 Tax=Burkholderia vietnamiensis (strain G4 / LMG 22486) TaxID=269482 RepID=A4JV86_BURVG|nr:hypothetical protein Bcep1808_7312 [Burkholderia vietnamiensis G4]MCB4349377.1 hypothetical protein [Burkholderia vietnamiensis]
MRNLIRVALGAVVLAASVQAAVAADDLVWIRTATVGGVEVRLPTTMRANGTMCVGYVARASREVTGELDLAISEICGKPVVPRSLSANGAESLEGYAWTKVGKGDLSIEIPQSVAESKQGYRLLPSGAGKKCALTNVVITGNADVRCAS